MWLDTLVNKDSVLWQDEVKWLESLKKDYDERLIDTNELIKAVSNFTDISKCTLALFNSSIKNELNPEQIGLFQFYLRTIYGKNVDITWVYDEKTNWFLNGRSEWPYIDYRFNIDNLIDWWDLNWLRWFLYWNITASETFEQTDVESILDWVKWKFWEQYVQEIAALLPKAKVLVKSLSLNDSEQFDIEMLLDTNWWSLLVKLKEFFDKSKFENNIKKAYSEISSEWKVNPINDWAVKNFPWISWSDLKTICRIISSKKEIIDSNKSLLKS